MPSEYDNTLNLPQTEFPMRASLAKREPDMLIQFQAKDIYKSVLKRNAGKPAFILHDGPPFSNGDIHLGHAENKTLKDIIVRYRNMTGYFAPFTPGWDNHGMPIESAIIKKNKLNRKSMSVSEFRSACQKFAQDYIDSQREQFKRLGIIGDWDHPYTTMDPKFEAIEVRVFGKMYEKGYIYKGLKPVYWCPSDETALAEAEIEYADDPCTAIFVKFKVRDDNGAGLPENTYFVIWTTTAWTLPGNLAISVHPDVEYALVQTGGETLIIALPLVESVMKAAAITDYTVSGTVKGSALEFVKTKHPFYGRDSIVICGEHVTTDTGTGAVHTAPGFGADDFEVCKKYGIDIIVPVDQRGILTEDALQYAGTHYSKVGETIIADLAASGLLLASEKITHSYPHCWRCKNPIIFRAAPQWFASVDAFKETAVHAVDDVPVSPEWGHDRLVSMVRERSDWCISRQRHWGLPIPVFYCEDCGKPVCTPETTDAVASLFALEGSNAWFEKEASEILPANFACPHCGSAAAFSKETDTLDGWFDSGSTHAAVLDNPEQFPDQSYPADVYLEGPDQFRGWFQSSLLTSVATKGVAPYRRILMHGWTVDGQGKAMHKSAGNAIAPDEIVNEYGADILRLMIASADYKSDMRVSKDIIKQIADAYMKIRNTARYILGNLNGFNPDECLDRSELLEVDRFALSKLDKLIETVTAAYESYEFHPIFHAVHNFCAVDMSNVYLSVLKDRLYCDSLDSISGKSARTAIYLILDAMVRLLAPILAFTSEEIWASMPHRSSDNAESVLLNDMPAAAASPYLTAEETAKWEVLLDLRQQVNAVMEEARAEKTIGKSLEAEIIITADETAKSTLFGALSYPKLEEWFIVSNVTVKDAPDGGLTVSAHRSESPKCPRCWNQTPKPDNRGLCPRCAEVVK